MKRNYDELLDSAREAMLEKLLENNHKPGFNEVTFEQSIGRTEQELGELKIAFNNYKDAEWDYKNNPSDTNKQLLIIALLQMRREAADTSNFPAMTILRCDKILAELEAET